MEFDNSFVVPLPPKDAWKVLLDIPRVAPCMPGAELTQVVDERTYMGKVSVRLGPVALTFAGTVKFEEIDELAFKARAKAQGTDAKAAVEFRLEPIPEGSRVLVHTDLALSGSVAQYGRGAGMIKDLASHLIGQFSDCLRMQLSENRPAAIGTMNAAAPPPSAAKPISGFSLMIRILWQAFARLFTANHR
jgi:carbon monoxide dehydrogenase subunit G